MTATEFNDWFLMHVSRFTGVGSWLAKFPIESRHGEFDVTRRSVREAWLSALRSVDVDDAKAATDAMFRGEEREPRSFDDHPKTILAIARRMRAERFKGQQQYTPALYVDGEPTFRCTLCHDRGYVCVYQPKSVNAMRAGNVKHPVHNPTGTYPLYTGIARCTCENDDPRNKDLRPYDPQNMIRCATLLENGDYLELQEAVANEKAGAPFNADAWESP